jgi:hypothetical protein
MWLQLLKYVPWVLVILALGAVLIWQWNSKRNLEDLMNQRTSELQKANLELGRANTKIGDANLLISKLSSQVQEEIEARNALLVILADLQASYEVEKKKVKTITKILYKDRLIDLPAGRMFVRLDDGTYQEVKSITYSYKDFRIQIEGDAIQGTLSYKLNQRFRALFAETHGPGGVINHYAELFELDDKGKDVGKMKLEKFDVVRSDILPTKMMWWNPKLDLGVGFGSNSHLDFAWVTDIGISLSAYGRTPNDIDWRFFRFGAGMSGSYGFSLSFAPVQYRIAKFLPLVSNIWLNLYGGYDFGLMAPHFGGGISVVF